MEHGHFGYRMRWTDSIAFKFPDKLVTKIIRYRQIPPAFNDSQARWSPDFHNFVRWALFKDIA